MVSVEDGGGAGGMIKSEKFRLQMRCNLSVKRTVAGVKYRRKTLKCYFQLGLQSIANQTLYVRLDAVKDNQLNPSAKSFWEYSVTQLRRIHSSFLNEGMITLIFADSTELSLTEADVDILNRVVEILTEYLKPNRKNWSESKTILSGYRFHSFLPYLKSREQLRKDPDLFGDDENENNVRICGPIKSRFKVTMSNSLVTLDISNCPQLQTMPTRMILMVSLRHLHCHSCRLVRTPISMPPNLQTLNLSDNRLTNTDLPSILGLNKLLEVNLSHNLFTSFPQGLAMLASCASPNKTLKRVNLSHNRLGQLCFDALGGYSPNCTVDISDNMDLPTYRSGSHFSGNGVLRLSAICLSSMSKYLNRKMRLNANQTMDMLTSIIPRSPQLLSSIEQMSVCCSCKYVTMCHCSITRYAMAYSLLNRPYFPDVVYSYLILDSHVCSEFKFCSLRCAIRWRWEVGKVF